FFALGANQTQLLQFYLGASLQQVTDGKDFGSDKTAFEIRVNLASRCRRLVTFVNRPGADLFLTSSEVGTQIQRVVARADAGVESRLRHAEAFEHLALGVGVELAQLFFQLAAKQ